jgi:hypothetical protein
MRPAPALRRSAYTSIAALAWLALLLPVLLRFDHSHQLLAIILALLLCGLALRSRPGGVAATLVFLAVIGDYRRYAGYLEGYLSNDPLLLVAPIAAGVLFLMAIVENRIRGSSALSLMTVGLMLMMVIQIFNPAQGSVAVGFSGALFYLVPMLWFWIGRAYGTLEFTSFLLRRVILPIGVAAALLGTYQSFRGLLPYQLAWTQAVRFDALWITADVIRPIGFFTSSAEHVHFLLVCSVISLAIWMRERTRILLALPLLLLALFLGSSRSPIIMFAGAASLLWAVSAGKPATWVPRLVIGAGASIGLLAGTLFALQQMHLKGPIDALVSHQVDGLLDPTNAEKSTAVGHLALAQEGLLKGLLSPAGNGLGATTLGATKYGAGVFNAEMDFSNMFYSLGVVGGLLYVGMIGAILSGAFRLWKLRRDSLDLAILGILAATFLSWLVGGEYGLVALMWFLIGALDRAGVELVARRREKARHANRLGIP